MFTHIFLMFALCLRVLFNSSVLCLQNLCYCTRDVGEYHFKKKTLKTTTTTKSKTETLKQEGNFYKAM